MMEGNQQIKMLEQEVKSLNSTVAQLAGQVTALVGLLDKKVDKEGVISQINTSDEGILISADKIRINGKTTIADNSIASAKLISVDASKILTDSLSAISTNLGNVNLKESLPVDDDQEQPITGLSVVDAKLANKETSKITSGTFDAKTISMTNLNQ
ncbi:hypothetical protein [Enterococcus olivae]